MRAKVAGFNFHKLDVLEDLKIMDFTEIEGMCDSKNVLITSTSFYEVIIYNDLMQFIIKSSILREIENEVKFKIIIKELVCMEENCYMLHNDGSISHYNVKTKELQPINYSKESGELIVHISATLRTLYGVSNKNYFYKITPEMELFHRFQSFQKVKKISSGLEHLIIQTNNGDVFGFGCCLRGQLGLGKMSADESNILLIDALAGIKIIDVACSAFSTVAVSSFGDVYVFGWNTNGQLGIKKIHEKCKQVYMLPEIVELEENDGDQINRVYCGYKHTFLRSERNKLYAAGLNNYGQLGINSLINEIDEFEIVNVDVSDEMSVFCGYWNTYLINCT